MTFESPITEAAQPVPKTIYWIGGSKGGVGKSMTAIAVLEHLRDAGHEVLLIESDSSNPDVWKAYRELVPCVLVDLDEADGWITLVNTCDTHRDHTIIINTAARNNVAVRQYGPTLDSSLEELGRPFVGLWVINRQRDSVELLREFTLAIPRASVHVVRNGYFGDERKFELYNESNVRETIESRGGASLTLPDLADRVADDLYTKRLSLSAAAKTLPIGNRAELARWRNEVRKVLMPILG